MRRPGWWATAAILLIAGGLVFWGGMQLVGSTAARADRAAERQQVTSVTHLATAMDTWFSDAEASVRGLAARLEPWNGAAGQAAGASRVLSEALTGDAIIDRGAVIADLSGRVQGGTPDHAALVGHQRPYLGSQAARPPAGEAPSPITFSDVVVEPLEHLQAVVVTVPLRAGDGQTRGFLSAYTSVPGGSLAARLRGVLTSAAPGAVAVSPGGVVFRASQDGPLERAGDDLVAPAAEAAGGPGLLRYRGEGASRRAAAHAPIRQGWSVVVPIDPDSLVAARTEALAGAGPPLAVLLLVAGGLILTADLRRRRADERALDQSRSFLALAGHELRTPLTMVRGFSETLGSQWTRLNPKAQQDALASVARQSRSLEQILTRLLLASQVDAGMVPEVAGPPIDVGELAGQVASHFQETSPLHEVTVDAPSGLEVAVDRAILEHVLANVIDNAVKFSPSGGKVSVEVAASSRTVAVTVEDEGVGLPSKRGDLFKRFAQREAVATRTYEEGGLGVGLFIVKSLTELAGGRVRLEPRSPRGARAFLELPRVRARRSVRRPRAAAKRTARTEQPASR